MSSSPIFFGVYAPQTSNSGSARLQAQLRTWLPVLVCVSLIAVESTSFLGTDRTSEPLQRIAETLFGYDVCVHWKLLYHLIRKTGHFVGYGMLSLVCFRGLWIALPRHVSRLVRQLRAHGLALVVTFLVASADEFHQSFLPNRDGQFSDVLLDTCGAMALGLLLFLAMQAAGRKKQAQKQLRHRVKIS